MPNNAALSIPQMAVTGRRSQGPAPLSLTLFEPSSLALFSAQNRRDGARLLSVALVITGAALVRFDHPIGRGIALAAGLLSLHCWRLYRRLPD